VAAASLPETITFVNPPVNIYVTFADGPGKYKMEILDSQGNHLRTLFDKHVGGESERWLEWDGTNEQGKLMPATSYSAIFSKDGKVLRKISLVWISKDQ
jgi:flagellar hook assembly protein FlgD